MVIGQGLRQVAGGAHHPAVRRPGGGRFGIQVDGLSPRRRGPTPVVPSPSRISAWRTRRAASSGVRRQASCQLRHGFRPCPPLPQALGIIPAGLGIGRAGLHGLGQQSFGVALLAAIQGRDALLRELPRVGQRIGDRAAQAGNPASARQHGQHGQQGGARADEPAARWHAGLSWARSMARRGAGKVSKLPLRHYPGLSNKAEGGGGKAEGRRMKRSMDRKRARPSAFAAFALPPFLSTSL